MWFCILPLFSVPSVSSVLNAVEFFTARSPINTNFQHREHRGHREILEDLLRRGFSAARASEAAEKVIFVIPSEARDLLFSSASRKQPIPRATPALRNDMIRVFPQPIQPAPLKAISKAEWIIYPGGVRSRRSMSGSEFFAEARPDSAGSGISPSPVAKNRLASRPCCLS
jgi:hypothetical protein